MAEPERVIGVPRVPSLTEISTSRRAAYPLGLVALSFLYRLPALLDAGNTNSDAAIVGLQAMHILRGELSWLLFGSTYQTSVDSMVAALWFTVLGPTPLALMLSTLAGHVALTLLVYATLARHMPRATAALLVLPLIFCCAAVHGNALYPPRQAGLTLAFCALFVLDGAEGRAKPALWAACGGALALLACFADPYSLIFLPLLGLHLLLAAKANWKTWALRMAAAAGGASVGAIPLLLLLRSPGSRHGETKLTVEVLSHNWAVLRDACLPWVLGVKVYAARHEMDYVPWQAPGPIVFLQWAGVLSLVVLLVRSLVLVATTEEVPWSVRRLGIVGLLSVPLTLCAFLVSPMVMDHFSARYLVCMLLLLPFALAPVAYALGARNFGLQVAPYLVSAAIGGWIAFAPATSGLAMTPGHADDDLAMGRRLRELGIRAAMADYWVSYRETFLYREEPVVVPSHLAQDRYRPYRAILAGETQYAYLIDRWRSEQSEEVVAERLAQSGVAYERIETGALVAFIVHAPPGKTPELASH